MSDTLDGESMMMAVGQALTGRVRSTVTVDAAGKERLLYIVLTNATPGDDEQFNDWYTNTHIPDVLAVQGFVASQRFRLVAHPALRPSPFRSLAISEVLAGQAESPVADLRARAGTDRMPLSPPPESSGLSARPLTAG